MRQLKPLESRHAIANRLRTAEGHLHAVTDMVESGAPCEEVLHQLDAVEAALCAAGRALRYCQFRQGIDTIRRGATPEARLAELARLAALYRLQVRDWRMP